VGHPSQSLTNEFTLAFLFVGFGYGRFSRLKTDLGVRPIAEWLLGRPAAAAERDCRLSGKVPFFAIRIDEPKRAFDAKWTVGSYGNRCWTLRHSSLPWFSKVMKFKLKF
jgi:hypothetical protein